MNIQFIRDRITELRIQKNVSEYKMSMDLGHSKSYIQSISSGKAAPSLSEFLYICEYLNVTPKDFFDTEVRYPQKVEELCQIAKGLSGEDVEALITVAKRIK